MWAQQFSGELDTVLPEVKGLESAKTYREKKAKPVLEKILDVLKAVYRELLNVRGRLTRLREQYNRTVNEKDFLSRQLEKSHNDMANLHKDSHDLQMVKQALGAQAVEQAIRKGRQARQEREQHSERDRV